jgi:hypothetical protein
MRGVDFFLMYILNSRATWQRDLHHQREPQSDVELGMKRTKSLKWLAAAGLPFPKLAAG